MDVDSVIEETAKDAAAKAKRIAAEETARRTAAEAAAAKAARAEAAKAAAEAATAEAAKAATAEAAGTGEETAKKLAEDQPLSSAGPSSSPYIAAGKDSFVSMPGTANIEELAEGRELDGEIITATATSEPKEEQLLQALQESYQKLLAFHRTRKEKLDSRAAIVEVAEGDFRQRLDETRTWYQGALQELQAYREQLVQERNELLLMQSDIEKAQEEAAQQAAATEALLTQRRIGLDAQEEDLAAHEGALTTKLRNKDEELEGLVSRRV